MRRYFAVPNPHETLPLSSLEADDLPSFGPSLAELARPGMRATIAFTDSTRRCPDELLIGRILRRLEHCGLRREDVTLLCATGLHRAMTSEERVEKLGASIAGSVAIADHHAQDPAELVRLDSIDGIRVVVDRRCVEADLLIATGVVEPHQYAGYSGGSKTVVIGCAGEATIGATHGASMIDRDGVRLGGVDRNPFQMFVRAAGRAIGLRYVVNVVLDDRGELVAAAEGAPDLVHDHLVRQARGVFEVPVPVRAHLAVAGVPESKAANLYQASRAATYLALAEGTPLLDGAPIIVPAAMPEGAGEGEGERRFLEMMSEAASPEDLLARLRTSGFPGGAQRAYVLAAVLARHPVIVAGSDRPDVVRSCHMIAAADMASALEVAAGIARDRFGDVELQMLEVPNALVTICRHEPAAL